MTDAIDRLVLLQVHNQRMEQAIVRLKFDDGRLRDEIKRLTEELDEAHLEADNATQRYDALEEALLGVGLMVLDTTTDDDGGATTLEIVQVTDVT